MSTEGAFVVKTVRRIRRWPRIAPASLSMTGNQRRQSFAESRHKRERERLAYMIVVIVDDHSILHRRAHRAVAEQVRQVKNADVTQPGRCLLLRAKHSFIERAR